jgi:hypothetical protein
MNGIAMVVLGFSAGLFTMTIISFYKWVLDKIN